MILIKEIKYFCNFFEDYKEKLFKKYKNENINLDFSNMDSKQEYNETIVVSFVIFDNLIYKEKNYIYKFYCLTFFSFKSDNELYVFYDFDLYNDSSIKKNNFKFIFLKYSEIDIELKNLLLIDEFFYNSSSKLSFSEQLEEYQINYWENYIKSIQYMCKKVEFDKYKKIDKDINFLNFKNKIKLNIFLITSLNSFEFPFWNFLRLNSIDKKGITYTKDKNKFLKINYKYENIFSSFINFNESFNFNFEDNRESLFITDIESINYKNSNLTIDILKNAKNLWLNYYYNFLDFNKKKIKVSIEEKYYIKFLSLTSLKSLGWILLNIYLNFNKIFITNYYTYLEHDMYVSSNYLGIQYLENKNDIDLKKIFEKLNDNTINSWEDLEENSSNTLYLNEYDINSAFTNACKVASFSSKGSGNYINPPYKDDIWEKKGFIFITADLTDCKDLCYLPFRDIFSKEVFYNLKSVIYGWYNILEIKQIKDFKGLKFEILSLYIMESASLIFKDFIDDFFIISNELKLNYTISKTILNSIWGLFSYKGVSYLYKDSSKSEISGKIYKNLEDTNDVIVMTENEKKKSKYFCWSSIITSTNRIHLKDWLFYVKNNCGQIYSINVDGFWTNLNLTEKLSNNIGGLKVKNKSKKIIFFNLKCYLNITDKFYYINGKKITDFDLIKKNLLKNSFSNESIRKSNIDNLDFIEIFYESDSIKKNLFKSILGTYNNYSLKIENYLLSNNLYKFLKNLFINENLNVEKDLKNKFDFSLQLNLCLFREKKLENTLIYNVKLNDKNNLLNFEKFFFKLDSIIYYWLENYQDNSFIIELNAVFLKDDIILFTDKLIIK